LRYRCVATSDIGFVQQLACNYLPHGYRFYVVGQIPPGKDPYRIDDKLVDKYGIDVSRATRWRRKKLGRANLHYLRFERTFLLLATEGKHRFFEEESGRIRDAHKQSIPFAGYSISLRRGQYLPKRLCDRTPRPDGKLRSRVLVARPVFLEWLAYFEEAARHYNAERLSRELYLFPYEPYAPVRRQQLRLLNRVNKVRKALGRSKLPTDVLRYRRRIVKPFGELARLNRNAPLDATRH